MSELFFCFLGDGNLKIEMMQEVFFVISSAKCSLISKMRSQCSWDAVLKLKCVSECIFKSTMLNYALRNMDRMPARRSLRVRFLFESLQPFQIMSRCRTPTKANYTPFFTLYSRWELLCFLLCGPKNLFLGNLYSYSYNSAFLELVKPEPNIFLNLRRLRKFIDQFRTGFRHIVLDVFEVLAEFANVDCRPEEEGGYFERLHTVYVPFELRFRHSDVVIQLFEGRIQRRRVWVEQAIEIAGKNLTIHWLYGEVDDIQRRRCPVTNL